MQRVTITIEDDLLELVDALATKRGYTSRSEAFRDIMREAVSRGNTAEGDTRECFATLSYVYEHDKRDLAKRLVGTQHDHHDLSISTLHVHVDKRDCLEVVVLKGPQKNINEFAGTVTSQRGVRHGCLHIIPSDT